MSVGSRFARVHLGSGPTGFSTGFGPVGYYTSLGGGRSRQRSSARMSTAASNRALQQPSVRAAQQAQAAAEATATLKELNRLMDLHREEFVNSTPPRADSTEFPNREQLLAEEMKRARDGVSWFDFSARRAAKTRAKEAAEQRFAEALAARREDRETRQAGLDQVWAKLNANDPETVLMVLEAAFEDNDAAATPVGVDGADLSVAVLVPGTDVIPDRMPYVTDSGRTSTKKMTKTMANSFYASMLSGYMIVTAKEAFAVAPGITRTRVVALRRTAPDAW